MNRGNIDGIAFVFFLMVIAVIGVVFINMGNIKLLSTEKQLIEKQSDYNLGELNSDSILDIKLTPSSIFKLEEKINTSIYSFFSTEEYVFDFIAISETYPNTQVTLSCRDVTDVQKEPRDKLVSEFNNPVDVGSVLEQEGITLSEESKASLMQNTTGQFGDATRLIDCTDGVVRSHVEVYFIIALESAAVLCTLVFIYRNRIAKLMQDEDEEIPENF